jgi:hypothetical protein
MVCNVKYFGLIFLKMIFLVSGGSLMVQSICKAFHELAANADLTDILMNATSNMKLLLKDKPQVQEPELFIYPHQSLSLRLFFYFNFLVH